MEKGRLASERKTGSGQSPDAGGPRERERRCAFAYTASATTAVLTCRYIDIVIICKLARTLIQVYEEAKRSMDGVKRNTCYSGLEEAPEKGDHRSRSVRHTVTSLFNRRSLFHA